MRRISWFIVLIVLCGVIAWEVHLCQMHSQRISTYDHYQEGFWLTSLPASMPGRDGEFVWCIIYNPDARHLAFVLELKKNVIGMSFLGHGYYAGYADVMR